MDDCMRWVNIAMVIIFFLFVGVAVFMTNEQKTPNKKSV